MEEVKNLLLLNNKEVKDLRADLRNESIRALRKELDCWHTNSRTIIESEEFKDAVLEMYHCNQTPCNAMCVVLGQLFPRNEVRAAHIVKRETQGDTMHFYGLEKSKIDDPRNGIPMLEPIELAFDRKQLCILHNPANQELRMKVLNPELLLKPLKSQQGKVYKKQNGTLYTFADVDEKVLQLPHGVYPYRRCLSMHAKFSYSKALQWGWIKDSAILDTYFNISDSGLREPLGLGMLTWKELQSEVHNSTSKLLFDGDI